MACLAIVVFVGRAQETKMTLELNYPKTVGGNAFQELFDGRGDIGIKYRFVDLGKVHIGLAYNSGWYQNHLKGENTDFKVNGYTLEPKVFFEYHDEENKLFRPYIGLGYNWIRFDAKGMINNFTPTLADDWDSGLAANAGLAFWLNNNLFVQSVLSYTYIKTNNVIDTDYTDHIFVIKFGMGYNF